MSDARRPDLAQRVGVVVPTKDGPCFIGPHVAAGGAVAVVLIGARPQRIVQARAGALGCNVPAGRRLYGKPAEHRRLTFVRPTGPAIALGLGVIGGGAARVSGANITIDLDADGDGERFAQCTSAEGVHITIWSGRVRRWHRYYYLGYDTAADCTAEETE